MSNTAQDTIVAIATAPGRGGVGVVRLSGPHAEDIAGKIVGDRSLTPRMAHFARFRDADGEVIDEGLVIAFPAPHSFTGEDVVELQGHGGPVILDMLVAACIAAGARQAQAGEFSQRAFLNDKMDLTQAEAIADLIDAGTSASARAALHSLQGVFSDQVNRLVEELIGLRIYVEAAIDFPEEEIDFLSDGKVAGDLRDLRAQCQRVLEEANQGRLVREGMTLVIAGKPNAGKSSLMNALAGFDAAIVTDIAGTTRDVLREAIQLDGMPLNLIDTAGLRDSADVVEQEGIRRAYAEMKKADRLLVMVDSRDGDVNPQDIHSLLPQSQQQLENLDLPVTVVLNKADLSGMSPGPRDNGSFVISAATGDGLPELREHLKAAAGFKGMGQGEGQSRFSARRRHITALEQALAALDKGEQQLHDHAAGELLAEDLRAAQKALEEITGAFTADDLLGRIFSSFCIGK
ncbi:MAG: tRNA uridine-5-carboxymethylaminomethyl(34) synthesis GTPase MnmE [Alcanivorax sp.]|jgi:tRNA modification GTPase|uniref:tRNA uridine-5-carboxymethylaminomethyl(34) synthesis GTPase MnmE n=2 Tax=Alcanivorax TaxID=59753 RepID=UPI0019BA1CA8|nr:tRNA uridine-5-carboxymethylaminomethyl(34) synthesis GTPase MnmE [Alcanivorax sp.]MBD3644443.1 tRNA uridine-5-carboxymethylaminomethyl(34) synthesis GTPase MnmE [Alcanivorax sp.]MDF1723772.1 tRNA uridine-5-carboxymethylaminomethyl(34) synthesis GTPase MnmE [Alcanivorax sp.]